MPKIHPSAIVDSRAQFADDVEIGPGCVIEGEVSISQGTRLLGNVWVQGPIRIGRGNTIYPFACLGLPPQDRKFDPNTSGAGTLIGDDNVLREGFTIHRATGDRPTTIGHRNYLMVNTHAGHDVLMGDDCTLANGVLLGGHVVVGDKVTMGGNGGVHQFCRVGQLSMLSGVISVAQDLPPFCIYYTRKVGSLNLVGLRRAGYRQHIAALQRAFIIMYKERHGNIRAAELIEQELGRDPLCMELAQFIRTTKRGISGMGSGRTPGKTHLEAEAEL